jgi:hypothetical protein
VYDQIVKDMKVRIISTIQEVKYGGLEKAATEVHVKVLEE